MKKIIVLLSICVLMISVSACSRDDDSCVDTSQIAANRTLENIRNVSIELSESATDELKSMVEGTDDARMFRIQAAKG